jgi:hypothetical protein
MAESKPSGGGAAAAGGVIEEEVPVASLPVVREPLAHEDEAESNGSGGGKKKSPRPAEMTLLATTQDQPPAQD